MKSFCQPREKPSVPYFVLIRMEKSTLTLITSISKACSSFIPFTLRLFLQESLVRRAAVAFPTFIPSRRKLIVMEMTASVRPAESAFCRKLTRSAHDDSELNLSDPTVVWGHVLKQRGWHFTVDFWKARVGSEFCHLSILWMPLSSFVSPWLCSLWTISVCQQNKNKKKHYPLLHPLKCGAYSWMKLIASLSRRTRNSSCTVCASDS